MKVKQNEQEIPSQSTDKVQETPENNNPLPETDSAQKTASTAQTPVTVESKREEVRQKAKPARRKRTKTDKPQNI